MVKFSIYLNRRVFVMVINPLFLHVIKMGKGRCQYIYNKNTKVDPDLLVQIASDFGVIQR